MIRCPNCSSRSVFGNLQATLPTNGPTNWAPNGALLAANFGRQLWPPTLASNFGLQKWAPKMGSNDVPKDPKRSFTAPGVSIAGRVSKFVVPHDAEIEKRKHADRNRDVKNAAHQQPRDHPTTTEDNPSPPGIAHHALKATAFGVLV